MSTDIKNSGIEENSLYSVRSDASSAERSDRGNLRIVFMGTPEFAVASLHALVEGGYNVVGVVTAPDKPGGRGMKLQESAVKKYAQEKNLPVLQPPKLKDPQFLEDLRSLKADLQVVVAFRMLPEVVWNMPPFGTINVHASLLPQYRGAAPINWVIINGERETGVTTFKLKHEIDTGNVLLQEKIMIGEDETAGSLHDKLKMVGAELLAKTVKALIHGTLKETPQATIVNRDESKKENDTTESHPAIKHAPKIFTETCRIDWDKGVDDVYNLVRGLSPHPAAFTELNGKMLKIFTAQKEKIIPSVAPGQWESDYKTYLKFACLDGYLLTKEIQLEGKKRMLVEDFLRGFKIQAPGP